MAPNARPKIKTGATTDTDTSAVEPGERCPVCEAAFDSVSVHEGGLMVNLLDNERYRRVCFEPAGGDEPRIRFYHHTHKQAAPAE
jgi:hypothetical protein